MRLYVELIYHTFYAQYIGLLMVVNIFDEMAKVSGDYQRVREEEYYPVCNYRTIA